MRDTATSVELLYPISIHMGFFIIILQNEDDSTTNNKGMISKLNVVFFF